MKKFLIFLVCIANFTTSKAQTYLGFLFDNYAGVHGVISNPANIVDSRFKTDINLASVSVGATNDYYALDVFKAINNSDFDFDIDGKKSPSKNNNFQENTDILGPSFLFNINKNNSIALSTRARAVANVSNVDGAFFNSVSDGLDSNTSFSAPSQNFNLVGNAWAEFGLTYATILLNKDIHFLKGGLTLKYLSGLNNIYSNANNLGFNYNVAVIPTPTTNIANTTGELTLGGVDTAGNYNNDIEFNSGTGFGADLGFIYEYRPAIEDVRDLKDKNKYLIKLGFSVTDFGSINYTNNKQSVYNLNGSFTQADFDALDFDDLLNAKYTVKANESATKYSLPTSAHLNLDWNIYNKFYLNANVDFNINSKTAVNTNTIGNNYSVTPRFESKWFSFFVPVNVMEYSGLQAGAGMRLGPLFVGSGSILTNLISDESKAADFYLGLKIPVYQGRIKDKDSDGVLDKNDDCPDVAGPADNKGCPYPDTDNDTILDKDDKCPKEAGDIANKGCPWGDADKDTVLDNVDKCPEVGGAAANNGCPWADSDKDGVTDNIDKCPQVFGIAANNGCPKEVVKAPEPAPATIKEDVIKKINDFSKTILFDSGKATIKAECFTSLDGIVSVLKEFPTANFKIEGHTDSSGKPATNLKLSQDRANAVKQYLSDKGIAATRLMAEGFGSTKPITTNATIEGKNLNRRVEINLIK